MRGVAGEMRPVAPVILDRVFEDGGRALRALAERRGPYRPIQRYFESHAELRAVEVHGRARPPAGAPPSAQPMQPWFREDWWRGEAPDEGVAPLVRHAPFLDAARRLYGAAIVEPSAIYANVVTPGRGVDAGHYDIPAFRGMHRHGHPSWLLCVMLRSGLFDRWHVRTCTIVSWFYDGEGGGFSYWPEGVEGPRVDRPCLGNTAIAADTDRMFHRIRSVAPGSAAAPYPLDPDSEARFDGAAWRVTTGGREVARFPREAVRVSLNWKAVVHASEEERRRASSGEDDLTLAAVLRRFADALAWPALADGDPARRVREEDVVRGLSERFVVPRPG